MASRGPPRILSSMVLRCSGVGVSLGLSSPKVRATSAKISSFRASGSSWMR